MPAKRTRKRVQPTLSKPTRPRGRPLGVFSVLVLSAIRDLPERHRYGARIDEYVTERAADPYELANLYIILKRLKKAGLVTCRAHASPRSPTHKVVGYTLTAQGRTALATAATVYAGAARTAAPN